MGQLLEYSMKNIFHEKLYSKCVGEVSPGSFHKKPKLSISLDQQSENVIKFVLIVCPIRRLPKYIITKVLTLAFILHEWFFRERDQELVS